MKKRNKLTAAVLAAAMVGSMAMPALATSKKVTGTDVDTAQKQSMKLTLNVPTYYEWKIPSDITFGNYDGSAEMLSISGKNNDSEVWQSVDVIESILPEDKKLNISMKGNGKDAGSNVDFVITYKDKENKVTAFTYTVKSNDTNSDTGEKDFTSGSTLFSVEPGQDAGSKYVKFILDAVDLYDVANVASGSELSDYKLRKGEYTGTVTYTAELVNAT